jgi:hypothetical protein
MSDGERRKSGAVEERERLIVEIERAFAETPPPDPITVCGSDCPECSDLTREFYGRRWREIDDAKLEANRSLSFFTPEAFCYFLPAYLRYSLRHFVLFSEVCEFTVYNLTVNLGAANNPEGAGSRISWIQERLSLLDRRQAAIVLRFLTLVSEDEELSGFHYDIGQGISDLKDKLGELHLLD